MTAPAAAEAAWYSTDNLLTLALGLFAFSVVFSVTAVQAALFLTLILLLVKKHREGALGGLRARITGHPLFLPWAVYLGVCLLTSVTAYYPAKAFGQLNSDFLKFVCLFTLLLAVKKEHLPKMATIYIFAAFAAAVVGITEAAAARLIGETSARANAFMNAVRYSEVMQIALALILSRLLLPRAKGSRNEKAFLVIALITVLIATILSQTRGAYLGISTMFAALFCFAAEARKKIAALALVMVGLSALVIATNLSMRARVIAMFQPRQGDFSQTSPSTAINIRFELWKLGLDMFKEHPALGVGPDNVKKVFKKFHPEPIGYMETWGSLHNLYIHQAAERGLPGLAALIVLFAAFFLFALRRFKATKSAYALWALCALPAYFAMNFTEISFQHVHTAFAIFMALAFAAAAEKETV